jgi:hypothetical protein
MTLWAHCRPSLHVYPNWFIENTADGRYADKADLAPSKTYDR